LHSLDQEELAEGTEHADHQHEDERHGLWPLPEERHYNACHKRAEHGGIEKRRAWVLVMADLAGEQYETAIPASRDERQERGGLEHVAAGADDDKCSDQRGGNPEGAARAKGLAQKNRAAQRDQHRVDVHDRGRLGQSEISQRQKEHGCPEQEQHRAHELDNGIARARDRAEFGQEKQRHDKRLPGIPCPDRHCHMDVLHDELGEHVHRGHEKDPGHVEQDAFGGVLRGPGGYGGDRCHGVTFAGDPMPMGGRWQCDQFVQSDGGV
jgi:hypothetical protein